MALDRNLGGASIGNPSIPVLDRSNHTGTQLLETISDISVTSTEINDLVDSYVTGTWTPKLQDVSNSDAESQTYTYQVGKYTKIGNMVFIHGKIQMSSIGTLTSQLRVAGLPYTSSNDTIFVHPVSIGSAVNLNVTSGMSLTGWIFPNVNHIQLGIWNSTTQTNALANTLVTGTFGFDFSGIYHV